MESTNYHLIRVYPTFMLASICVLICGCELLGDGANNDTSSTDFFPLFVGNQWTFQFTHTLVGATGLPRADSSRGIMEWQVVNVANRLDTTVFSISVGYEGIFVFLTQDDQGNEIWSEPEIITCEKRFNILQVEDSLWTHFRGTTSSCQGPVFNLPARDPPVGNIPWIEYPVARYYDTAQDTVVVPLDEGNTSPYYKLEAVLVRDEGIADLLIEHRGPGPLSSVRERLELLSFEQVSE